MKIKEVIEILKTKDPEWEVQFIVARTDGQIIAMEAKDTFVDVMKFLKSFKKPKNRMTL